MPKKENGVRTERIALFASGVRGVLFGAARAIVLWLFEAIFDD